MRFLVTSIFLYACESWTLTAELQRLIQAMEMRCYHKMLCISYKDHVINKEVHAKIQQAIGPHEDLLTIVKRCKLQWYGHVSCPSGLVKPSYKAQWKGEEDKADRGNGGKTTSRNGQACSSPSPRGQWRTGKWRKLFVKSSVVPQRPSWWRDRWWWDDNYIINKTLRFFRINYFISSQLPLLSYLIKKIICGSMTQPTQLL